MLFRPLPGRDLCARGAALSIAPARAYERVMCRGPVQRLVALVLAVALTAMGVAAASARGQTMVGGQVAVLCSGGGIVQLALDADGNPTGESHLCPDLAAALLGAFRIALPAIARPEGAGEALAPVQPRFAPFAPRAASRARGPPVAA